MKDLYSFDISEESAYETYDNVTKAYENIFNLLEIPVFQGLFLLFLYCSLLREREREREIRKFPTTFASNLMLSYQ
jgi:hypothetical protein